MLGLALISSFFVNHLFYESYGGTESIWDWSKPRGSGSLYLMTSFKDERDYLIGRRSTYYEGFIRQSFAFLNDTGSLALDASQKRQGGPGYSALEGAGGGILFLAARPRLGTRLFSTTQLESRGYSSGGEYQDNSGIREDAGLDITYPGVNGDIIFTGENRDLVRETSVRASPRFSLKYGVVNLETSVGNRFYTTVAGGEDKSFSETHLSGAFPDLGFLRIEPSAYYSKSEYSLNKMNSNTSVGASVRCELRAVVAGTQWRWGIARGEGARDFTNYPNDENNHSATLDFLGQRTLGPKTKVLVKASLERNWYDFPEGVISDTRDERTLSTLMRLKFTPRRDISVEAGLLSRGQDLVFLDPSRSQETRRQNKYSAFARCFYSGPVSVEFRGELSAIYNTYRFNPQGNLLIRFYENAVFLKSEGLYALVKWRLQDQGSYISMVYYPGAFYREIWFQPSVRFARLWSTSLLLMGSYYLRDERGSQPSSPWVRNLEERGFGLGTRSAGKLEAHIMMVKRTGQEPFWDIGLYYNPGQLR